MAGELTDQQQAIARLVAAGRTNQQIADELGISRRSVQRHVQTLLNKLELYDRRELAAWVQKQAMAP